MTYTAPRAQLYRQYFNPGFSYPYGLQQRDIETAIQDVYDFFQSTNTANAALGLDWFERIVRPAAVSNVISDLVTESLAKKSNGLTKNLFHNGHPDLIPIATYPNDAVKAGDEGIEIKATKGRVADTHGARDGWVCQINYWVDPEPIRAKRRPTTVRKIYLAKVTTALFRRNDRGELGTRTATLDREGLKVLRAGCVYDDPRDFR